jgi:hypothetical protein
MTMCCPAPPRHAVLAGHMVPEYQPAFAFEMLRRALTGAPF